VLPGECPPHPSPHALGRIGEELAAAHLVRLGFEIIARNVRTRHGEIDLIAYDGVTLVFAEVKSRRGSSQGPRLDPATEPLAGLRAPQCARLRRLAAAWLSDTSSERPVARNIRFDAIGVTLDRQDRLLSLDHIEAAW
jgi:putative endonuclease